MIELPTVQAFDIDGDDFLVWQISLAKKFPIPASDIRSSRIEFAGAAGGGRSSVAPRRFTTTVTLLTW